ncbi:type 2 lanthipeptide synthetase LanM, partial [Rossellomorea marisflavi]|uniref:type 2 lanthipeptide synthetase LanM n=1 Tax=Rossellomorea marisflavi TaxID=189381 RepID=UPI00295EAAA4
HVLLNHKAELIENNGIIDVFNGDTIRHITRPTAIYSNYLDAATHPKYLGSAKERENLFGLLYGLHETLRAEGSDSYIPYEISDLLKNDVPYFSHKANEKVVMHSNSEPILETFRHTAIERAKVVIERLSEEDLQQQLRYIYLSLNTLKGNLDESKPTSLHAEQPSKEVDLRQDIRKIAEDIISKASMHKGRPFWITNKLEGKKIIFSTLQLDMYDGLSGLGIFYAQAGRVLNDSKYTETAHQILSIIQEIEQVYVEESDSISAYSGVGSLVHLYTYVGNLWGDDSLLENAEHLLVQISEKLIRNNHHLKTDFISGLAGLLKVATNLYSLRRSSAVNDCLQLIYSKLYNNCTLLLKGELQSDNVFAGFSHGFTGIAYSLSQYLKFSDEKEDVANLIKLLLNKENEYFVPEYNNWRDIRDNDREMSPKYWCHGSPGILLGRMKIQDEIKMEFDNILKIEEALMGTLDISNYNNHSICHGMMGNTLILDEYLNINEDVQACRILKEWKNNLGSPWVNAAYNEAELLGLFLGESGFGYGLLKLEDKDVPSILTLDI